ncbi:efflux transporter outer membrane subunit [Ramlibacter pallidus]|uniref:Efflux transporter outer membrane subunit n=1 Tax=Ramlibacter pallidus TaxID=2780087 RepID=A0ABR9S1J4_9BURK|nr:efflux transporter outer membrane subunit [Ramlibacter pallidus]MBE7367390.1 efflux transporter outer membrane subunit [Ramlibacter pallidus]
MKLSRTLAAAAGLLWLAGCAVPRPPAAASTEAPPRWHAPLPHAGTLADLRQWWQQFNDPLLVDLVEAAQTVNPNVATAGARIAEARAARVAARAALLPALDGNASVSRGNAQQGVPTVATIAQTGLQLAWELDVFGGRTAQADAARARLAGSEAGWHEARVAVAAETALSYLDLRTCERQLAVTRNDARSRAETARLTQLSADAGFTAPAVAAQARASAAEGSARSTQQQAQCDLTVKALVALTGLAEPALRQRLAAPWAEPTGFALLAMPAVPARLLAQRPDVFAAERAVEAASAEVGVARADRFPRVSLGGQISTGWIRAGGQTNDAQTWTIGPLALTVPVFDAGRRAAAEDAAQARYEEAVALYAARVRQAVREVEEALVNLESARERSEDARIAVEGYRASFAANEALYRSGLGSLIELEDQRRVALAAETALVSLQRERVAAWIALYRALGGGWERPDAAPAAPQP